MNVTTIGIDLAKSVFQLHGVDAKGAVVSRKKLRRSAVLDFLRGLLPLPDRPGSLRDSALLGPRDRRTGHDVRLIPPAYAKPYVKRQKNDAADAEAICEAVPRPTMRCVPVKSEERQRPMGARRTPSSTAITNTAVSCPSMSSAPAISCSPSSDPPTSTAPGARATRSAASSG